MTQEKNLDGDVQPAKPEVTDLPLSNSLADLAERAGEAYRLGRSKEGDAARAHLECGSILVRAKAECVHGEWKPFLKQDGISERSAQRRMQIFASGMSAETIVKKGA